MCNVRKNFIWKGLFLTVVLSILIVFNVFVSEKSMRIL